MSRANPVKRDSPANQARSHHIYRPWGTFVVARRGDGIIHKLPLTFLNCIYQAVIKPANHSCCERRCISGHRFHRVERSDDRKYVCVRRLGVVRNLEILEDSWVNLFFSSYLSNSSCLSIPSFQTSVSFEGISYTSVFPDFLDKCRQGNERTDCWERNRIQASRLWKNVDKVNMKREKYSARFKAILVNWGTIPDKSSWEGCTTQQFMHCNAQRRWLPLC